MRRPSNDELLELLRHMGPDDIANTYGVCRATAYGWIKKATKGDSATVTARKPRPGKSLADLMPEVSLSWHQEKNAPLTARDVAPSSNAPVWWRCTLCQEAFERSVNDRTRGRTLCRVCARQQAGDRRRSQPKRGRSLREVNPQAAAYWHPTLNGERSPDNTNSSSHDRAWWTCADCRKAYEASVSAKSNGRLRCRACATVRAAQTRATARPGESIADLLPDLIAEWDWKGNPDLDPRTIRPTSTLRVSWRCSSCGASYKARVANKASGTPGCSPCVTRRVAEKLRRVEYEESLAARYPAIAKEWVEACEGQWTPENIRPKSSLRVLWRCHACLHEWVTTPGRRVVDRTGCPPCARAEGGTNRSHPEPGKSLGDLAPELIPSWDPGNEVSPFNVKPTSVYHAVWNCLECDHKWRAVVHSRVSGAGCGHCGHRNGAKARSLPRPGRSLAECADQSVLHEWDAERNGDITPVEVAAFSSIGRHWICANGHTWIATPGNRMRGDGCRKCSPIGVSKQEIRLYAELRHVLSKLIGQRNCHHDYFVPEAQARYRKADMAFTHILIEMDGSWWHQGKSARDRAKSKALSEAGYIVVRVREKPLEALSQLDLVVEDLADTFEAASSVLAHLAALAVIPGLDAAAQQYARTGHTQASGYAERIITMRISKRQART